MSKEHPLYDCALIGGGLVGCVTALALAQAGHHVALIDKTDPAKRHHSSTDRRGIAIAAGSVQLLQNLGLWETMQGVATPILDIHVSNANRRGSVHYGQEESEGIPMGYIVEGYRLKLALENAVNQHPSIDCHMPRTLKTLEDTGKSVLLSFESCDRKASPNPPLEARLCLASDGKNSWVREHLNLPSKNWNYDQTALVFVVHHEKPHNNIAFEHFLPRGPLALLPLPGNRSSVVWTESMAAAKRMLTLKDDDFSEEITRLFGPALGKLSLEGKRFSYPLSGQISLNPRKGRCVLIGDAAHSIHPVAGQGFNLGLRDVQWIATHALSLLDSSKVLETLATFPRQRVSDITSMTALTHGLVKLFSNDSGSLGFLRSAGLELTNKFSFLKKRLTRHAMGLSGS